MGRPMDGFEDMRPKEIIGTDAMGRSLVMMKVDGKDTLVPFKQYIGPTGVVMATPDLPDTSVDQEGGRPRLVPVSERWRGVDQAQ